MIDPSHPLLLGSASPRRREILAILRVPIVIAPSDADEVPRPTESPSDYLARVVREKLLSVAPHARTLTIGGVIVADTLVLLDDTILGKPSSVAEAASMVRRLSGRRHEVWTRFGIARPEAPDVHVHEETVRTAVVFRSLGEREILRYAQSGEGLDKAGAYAVQGLGAFAVSRIEGSYPNVVGLPSCEVIQALLATGLLADYPP